MKRLLLSLAAVVVAALAAAQTYNYNANPPAIQQDVLSMGVARFNSANTGLLTPQGAPIVFAAQSVMCGTPTNGLTCTVVGDTTTATITIGGSAITPSTITVGTVTVTVIRGTPTMAATNLMGTASGLIASTATHVLSNSVTATVTNDSAPVGSIGQYTSTCVVSGSAVALTDSTAADVTSVALAAGDWDVSGNVNFAGGAATVTAGSAGISTTTATLPTDGSEVYDSTRLTTTTATSSISAIRKRVSLAGSGTAYLVASKSFSAGTVGGFGCITARRAR